MQNRIIDNMKDVFTTTGGWICPMCFKTHSPYVLQCDCNFHLQYGMKAPKRTDKIDPNDIQGEKADAN